MPFMYRCDQWQLVNRGHQDKMMRNHMHLKGIVWVFWRGSYKVHIYSRYFPYRNHWSAQPQFGEIESCSSPDAQLCSAVNRVQMQSKFKHLKQGPPKKCRYQFKCTLYRENSHQFTSPSDRPFFLHYIFDKHLVSGRTLCFGLNYLPQTRVEWSRGLVKSTQLCPHKQLGMSPTSRNQIHFLVATNFSSKTSTSF